MHMYRHVSVPGIVRAGVCEDHNLQGWAGGAGLARATVHFPGGLGEVSFSHPRSTQIHLCRGISLNIQ